MSRALHERQILLVGEAGQRAIEASSAFVDGPGFVHEVATLYATRAGFEGVERGSISVERDAPREMLSNDAARETVAAARAVLREVRRAIETLPEAEPRS